MQLVQPTDRIFVAGHNGMVGSAMLRALASRGFSKFIQRDRQSLDLRDERAVREFFREQRPDVVVLAAARVGGIAANAADPVGFLVDNLRIQTNVITSAAEQGVRRLLFFGSSCIYPRDAAQPLREEALLTGALEPTNEGYALAKIAGLKMCEFYAASRHASFVSVMPTNLYGPGDNFDADKSHVIPAMLRRFHEAKVAKRSSVTCWGTGSARRDLLHCDDMAAAACDVLQRYEGSTFLNIGSGEDFTIRELAALCADVVGFDGEISWDASKPDGTPRKLLDVTKLRSFTQLHVRPLREGLQQTYRWAVAQGAFSASPSAR